MKLKFTLTILASTVFISACNDKTPNCSDPKTKDLAISLIKEELAKDHNTVDYHLTNQAAIFWIKNSEKAKYDLKDIVTKDRNEKLDTYICSANAQMSIDEQSIKTYLDTELDKFIASTETNSQERIKQHQNQLIELENNLEHSSQELSYEIENAKTQFKQKITETKSEYKTVMNDWESRHKKALSDFDLSVKNKGQLSDNERSSLNRSRQAIINAYEEGKSSRVEQYESTLNYYQKELEELPKKAEQYLQQYKEQTQTQKHNIEQEIQKIEKDKLADIQKYRENVEHLKEKIKQGHSFPIQYKVESSDDKKEFFVTVK